MMLEGFWELSRKKELFHPLPNRVIVSQKKRKASTQSRNRNGPGSVNPLVVVVVVVA